jgi:hypothetical protein
MNPDNSVRNTILRSIPVTPPSPLEKFGLFRAQSNLDFTTPAEHRVDFHTANRLLCKVANNTTTRSHVFMIWAGYDLFEAHQPDPTNNPQVVQIGAKIDDIPGHREFTVVDMSRLEEALTGSGAFDFRQFIIYRKRIQ